MKVIRIGKERDRIKDKTELSDLDLGVVELFGSWKILTIIADFQEFKDWLRSNYHVSSFDRFFDGYKFFVVVIVLNIIDPR